MLGSDDADLVRRDHAIAGLATVLDAEAILTELDRRTRVTVRGATSSYLRYKPGVSCLVLWELDLGGSTLLLHAKAYGDAQRDKFAAHSRMPKGVDSRGVERSLISDRTIIIYPFPDDRLMPALSRLNDGDFLEEVFPEAGDLRIPEWRTLRYKPERRHVACLGPPEAPVAGMKLHGSDRYRAAQRLVEELPQGSSYRLARRIGGSRMARAVAFEWVPGETLSSLFDGHRSWEAAVARSATALAELHGNRNSRLAGLSSVERARNLRALSGDLQDISPRLAPRLERLAGRIAELIVVLPQGRSVIHGDFYADQVVVGSESIGLIDLDNAAIGNRESDVGNFLAHLEARELKGDTAGTLVRAAGAAFVEAYEKAARRSFAPGRLQLETAFGLYRLLPLPFRTRRAGWDEEMGEILERAERLAEQATQSFARTSSAAASTSVVSISDEPGATRDPMMPLAALATDPALMQLQLPASLADHGDSIHLGSIRVARHRQGRRSVIEYGLTIDGSEVTLVGRLRARGPQTRTFRLNCALWAGAFGPFAPDGIMVPEPLALMEPLHLWLQRKVRGRDATEALLDRDWRELATRIALTARKLHESPLTIATRHTRDDELTILRARLGEVTSRLPELQRRIDSLMSACAGVASQLPEPFPVLIHRDFYADHILFDGSRTFLIDLDLATGGDPALDIGNFVAHLTEQGLRLLSDPDALADRADAIVHDYCQLSPEVDPVSIEAYAALSLARHVALSAKIAGRRHLLGDLLDLAESRLARFPERIAR